MEVKKLKKMLFIFGVAILLIFVNLTGCSDNKDNEGNPEIDSRFIGTWKSGAEQYNSFTFLSDGIGNGMGDFIEWKIKNETLEVFMQTRNITITYNFEFLENNTVLILTDDKTGFADAYTKQ